MKNDKTAEHGSEPREFLRDCRRILGDSFLMKLFKGMTKSELHEDSRDLDEKERAAFNRRWQRWTAQRPYVGEEAIRENYLEKHEILLRDLMLQAGGEAVARGIVARHAHLVGCELRCLDPATADKATIEEECLDDLPVLAEFHRVLISDASSPEDVRSAWQAVKQEMDQNFELFTRLKVSR